MRINYIRLRIHFAYEDQLYTNPAVYLIHFVYEDQLYTSKDRTMHMLIDRIDINYVFKNVYTTF